MHDHLWRDNWIEFKARLMAQWEHLTHHELDAAADKREHVLRHIEAREGVDRPEAERRLREVERSAESAWPAASIALPRRKCGLSTDACEMLATGSPRGA
jgi:hypothetical protein